MTATVDKNTIRVAVLDRLAEHIGETCATKGFREDWETADWLEGLADQLERDEVGFDDGDEPERLRAAANTLRNCVVATKLALVCSEVGEALETLRDHGVKGIRAGEGNFGEEIADAQIRLLELNDLLKITGGMEVVAKLEKNSKRPHRHGRKF